ncbi:MAG: hypothetical protein WB623_19480, partial [Candidatus Sulfotelmatobacter sp.]
SFVCACPAEDSAGMQPCTVDMTTVVSARGLSGGELCGGLCISGDAISADSEGAAAAKDELRSCSGRLGTNG